MAKQKAAPAGGDQSGGEIMIVFGVALILFMLWYAYHTKIATLVLGVRGMQAWLIGWFTDGLEAERQWIRVMPRSKVTFGDMVTLSSRVGAYTRWVAAPILLWWGYKLFKNSPTERFRKTYTDVTLPKAVAGLYPWMRISVTNDFVKMDQEKGPWAIALTERQFVRKNGLRNEAKDIDEELSTVAFNCQLEKIFDGFESMKPHLKALCALFMTRANRDFDTGDKLLLQLASSYASNKPNFDGVDALIAKYKGSKIVKKLVAQHAYEKTLMMSLLEAARGGESGKDYLPPNWFLWLKGVDRSMWYALSDVGRRTAHVECAGPFGHWLAEKTIGKKQEVPWVDNAVQGLVNEVAKFVNDDDEHDGIFDTDAVRDFEDVPQLANVPSPEQVENAIKTGASRFIPNPIQFLKK